MGRKLAVFTACLLPLALLAWQAGHRGLGANPIEAVIHQTGEWALRFVLLTLAVSPLRDWTGWRGPMNFRRMLGLFAFFYASLHLAAYIVLDQYFEWPAIAADILKRPYITVGMLGWALMVPLAATSGKAMMRRLGRYWKRLHRLVYVVGVCGAAHYLWLVKADLRGPLVYAGILAVLLGWRLWKAPAKMIR